MSRRTHEGVSIPYLAAMPWEVQRWRDSDAFHIMTLAAQGAYLNLCMAAWGAQPTCRLSNDDRVLSGLCGARSMEQWLAVKSEVFAGSDGWALTDDGKWCHSVVLQSYIDCALKYVLGSEGGRTTGPQKARGDSDYYRDLASQRWQNPNKNAQNSRAPSQNKGVREKGPKNADAQNMRKPCADSFAHAESDAQAENEAAQPYEESDTYEGMRKACARPDAQMRKPRREEKRIEENISITRDSVVVNSVGLNPSDSRPLFPAAVSDNENGNGSALTDTVSSDAERLASLYLSNFNFVFGRRLRYTPNHVERIKARLRAGYKPWHIVALPILVDAQGLPADMRRELDPSVPLRDGKHARVTKDGHTAGATDWLERAMGRIDRTTFTPRHVEAATKSGVISELRKAGVTLPENAS